MTIPFTIRRLKGCWHFGWVFCLAAILLMSCGKEPGTSAQDSDANGYLCSQCGTKFYTERKVFAEFCPKCKSTSLKPVVGYVCDKCQHVTLSAQAHSTVTCEKCNASVSASKLPSEAELAGWGATKQEKAAVSR